MTDSLRPFGGISGSTLKLIAVITMFIDHTGATVLRALLRHPAIAGSAQQRVFWSGIYGLSRDVGRLAFPIFCFLLVEGFLHTRSTGKYAGRLFLFALISELPFDLALKGSWFYPAKQNVYFTLLLGLLAIMAIRSLTENGTKRLLLGVVPIALAMVLAQLIDTDYNYKGVFLICILYLMHENRLYQCIGGAAAVTWELPAPLAFLPVWLYNGSRGLRMKYFFYWFYPVHLLLLHVLAQYAVPALPL